MEAQINTKNINKEINLDFKESKYATGRRKTSIAKVWLKKGSGNIFVNGKKMIDSSHCVVSNIVTNGRGSFTGTCRNYSGGKTTLYIRFTDSFALQDQSGEGEIIILGGEGVCLDKAELLFRERFPHAKIIKRYQQVPRISYYNQFIEIFKRIRKLIGVVNVFKVPSSRVGSDMK